MAGTDSIDQATLKKRAAEEAVMLLQSGMVVGLGGGSTTEFALHSIADRLARGDLHDIKGVPCSAHVEGVANQLGIPLTTLDDHPVIDLTIDGADEVDPDLNLIKGGGGALLREKMVAQASLREIIIVDESKLSPVLGTHWVVPVEVIRFGWRAQIHFLERLGGSVVVRQQPDGTLFQTDQGNLILDCRFGPISQPRELALKLNNRAGIVEHGLFIDLASEVIVASRTGNRHLMRNSAATVS